MNPQQAEALIRTDDPAQVERGLAWLRADAEARPDDVDAWFRYGGGLDRSGDEAGAMTMYERVRDLGIEHLPPQEQPNLYLQAGSTLRNLGRFEEARDLLADGVRLFPEFRALRVFVALNDVSRGEPLRAVDSLLEVILAEGGDDRSIQTFRRAIDAYAADLRDR